MIVINARFLTQTITGVQRYAIEICRELKKLRSDIVFIAPHKIINSEVSEELGAIFIGLNQGHLWEQIDLPLYLKSQGNPLLLNLANTAPIFYKNKIAVIHDVAFERFPQSFSWEFRYAYQFAIPRIIKSSIVTITDSLFSQDEIVSLYGVDENKIKLVYCAVSDQFTPLKCQEEEKYILAVSSLNYQKNFHSLIKAFNLLKKSDVKLYLVGAINKNFADHQLIEDIESNPNITFLGRIDDEELVELYSNAQCFVYPSLYEGFGIPPLEAQACGCPCVVSNAASLPEVCGDSVVYCDPYDIEDMTRKLDLVLSDQVLRDELRQKGFENIKRFSWEKSAQKVLQIIEENT